MPTQRPPILDYASPRREPEQIPYPLNLPLALFLAVVGFFGFAGFAFTAFALLQMLN